MIDLRSDTVTVPTPAMRQAMATAPVGDDVYDEDPTIHALEERAAELLGHDEAVFLPTATMANQIALRTLTQPGDEVLAEELAHVLGHSGAAGVFLRSGAQAGILAQVRDRLPLFDNVRHRIPDGVEEHEHRPDVVPVGDRHELVHPLEEADRVLLPELVVEEHPHRVHA